MIGFKSRILGALLSATLMAPPASGQPEPKPRSPEPPMVAPGLAATPALPPLPPPSAPSTPSTTTAVPPQEPAALAAPATSPPSAPDGAAGPAPPGTLSLTRRQAIAEALARNPGIAASVQQVAEARAQAVTAAAFADPTLSADTMGETRPLAVGSGSVTDLALGVTVPFPGKRGLRRDVAMAAVKAAELSLAQTRQQVASQTAQDYDALLVALRHRDDLRQSKEFSADFLTKTQARFLGGTAPKVDVVKAKVDLAQAENALIANERTIDSARATLNRILGRLGGAPLELTQPLDVPPPLPDVEALERLAEASRPELLSNEAQRQGAKTATRLAREFWAPDFNLTLGRNAFQGGPTTYTTTLLVGFPIFFWQHEQGEVANARHRESELAANASDLRAQVSLDVRSSYSTASTALRQAVFIRDELLPEAREVYRVASLSYGLGATSAIDLLDAKRTLVDAQRQYVDALGSANDAQAALELALGAPLPPAIPGAHP